MVNPPFKANRLFLQFAYNIFLWIMYWFLLWALQNCNGTVYGSTLMLFKYLANINKTRKKYFGEKGSSCLYWAFAFNKLRVEDPPKPTKSVHKQVQCMNTKHPEDFLLKSEIMTMSNYVTTEMLCSQSESIHHYTTVILWNRICFIYIGPFVNDCYTKMIAQYLTK